MKKNKLLGEIVTLFDTKGQEIKSKEADAKLKTLELAQMQLSAPSGVSAGVIIIAVVAVLAIGVGVYFLTVKK